MNLVTVSHICFCMLYVIIDCIPTPGKIILNSGETRCVQSPFFITQMSNGELCYGEYSFGQKCSWEIQVYQLALDIF